MIIKEGVDHMITSITTDNASDKEEGERKVAKLQEITKRNFHD